jgi:hypothetical protein
MRIWCIKIGIVLVLHLLSCEDADSAVDLIKGTQDEFLLRKVASNNKDVLQQFLTDDSAKNLKDLSFETETYIFKGA